MKKNSKREAFKKIISFKSLWSIPFYLFILFIVSASLSLTVLSNNKTFSVDAVSKKDDSKSLRYVKSSLNNILDLEAGDLLVTDKKEINSFRKDIKKLKNLSNISKYQMYANDAETLLSAQNFYNKNLKNVEKYSENLTSNEAQKEIDNVKKLKRQYDAFDKRIINKLQKFIHEYDEMERVYDKYKNLATDSSVKEQDKKSAIRDLNKYSKRFVKASSLMSKIEDNYLKHPYVERQTFHEADSNSRQGSQVVTNNNIKQKDNIEAPIEQPDTGITIDDNNSSNNDGNVEVDPVEPEEPDDGVVVE